MQRIALATLICGIMPGLMGLSYYGNNSNRAYAAKLSIDNISTMQEMRPGICHNMNIGDTATLTDTRDESIYTIAKLSDGKCWMTENLRLKTDNDGGMSLTPNDSDVENDWTLPKALTSLTSNNFSNSDYYKAESYYKSDTLTTDGVYYSFTAATAGKGNNSITTNNANVENSSVCPKGWKLPKGGAGTTNDFAIVGGVTTSVSAETNYWSSAKNISFSSGTLTVNGSTWRASGDVIDGSLANAGSIGVYWSSTVSNSNGAYRLTFHSDYFTPANEGGRSRGRTVRCLSDSYAEEDVNVVAVKVAPTISIDASTGARVEVDPNVVSTDGTITATISANTTYDVLLSADEPNLVSTTDTTKYIPASSNIAIRTNGWGIKNEDNTYSAITTSPTTYYNTSSYDETKQQTLHTFSLGISIAPSLPSGTYSTTVTVTAVNN